jgi:predicted RNase H-like HicB family nuclease
MKITVEIKEVHSHIITVDVPDNWSQRQRSIREAALETAQQLIAEGHEGELEYDRTLDPEQWTVRDENGNYFES